MKKGNITKRECYDEDYNEYCGWDIKGIIDYIEKVYEDAPEIGLETIINRTWEKAGGHFVWVSFFDRNKRVAKFLNYRWEHGTVIDCEYECSISQEYSDRMARLHYKEENEEIISSIEAFLNEKKYARKNYPKIKKSLIKHFGEYSVPATFGVPNPYFGINSFSEGEKEYKKLMKDLKKLSIDAGVGRYEL